AAGAARVAATAVAARPTLRAPMRLIRKITPVSRESDDATLDARRLQKVQDRVRRVERNRAGPRLSGLHLPGLDRVHVNRATDQRHGSAEQGETEQRDRG